MSKQVEMIDVKINQLKVKKDLLKTEMMDLISNELYGVPVIDLYPSREYINILKRVHKLCNGN
jgi:hypothetical protein